MPNVEELRVRAEKSSNANDAWDKIEKIIDRKIGNGVDSIVHACDRARECLRVWNKFKKDHSSDEDVEKRSKITDKRQIVNYFKQFFKDYKKEFDNYENPEYDILDESLSSLSSKSIASKVRMLMHSCMMCEASESTSEEKAKSFDAS